MATISSRGGLTDTNIRESTKLIRPVDLWREEPLSTRAKNAILLRREEIGAILRGDDHRVVFIVGPCSIHNPEAFIEYAERLAKLSDQVGDIILLVPRVHGEKPRTKDTEIKKSWKGMVTDPSLSGKGAMNSGLRRIYQLMAACAEMGIPASTEILNIELSQHLSPLPALGVLGARSVEDPDHRHVASGSSMPIGAKNTTTGNIIAAVNAAVTARVPHSFAGIDRHGRAAQIDTLGNPHTFVILRGADTGPLMGPNHDEATVREVQRMLEREGLRPVIVIDCAHGNAGPDPHRRHEIQPGVFRSVLRQMETNMHIVGLMLESNLLPGRQDIIPGKTPDPRKSVTDACVGWDETAELILEAREVLLKARRD